MEPETEQSGSCLCGAVRVIATPQSTDIGVCHCAMCRKWGGGPFFSVTCGPKVRFDGSEHVAVFDSSEWAQRGFCRQCGTHLFYRLKQDGHYAIPVGLFDLGNAWTLVEQIFIDQKPSFYSLAETTRNLTGTEVFAQYYSGG
jgi:hypothetical protein